VSPGQGTIPRSVAERPAVSVVVCTRGRAGRLRVCLQAFAEIHSVRPWELVVVDNASNDDTQSVLEESRATLPVPLVVVFEPVPGVTRSRNRGWRSASAEIVVFTDDDCYPAPDVVDRIVARFDEDSSLGFVGGAVHLHDPADARLATVTRSERLDIQPGMFITAGTILSANLAFRRTVLEAIGGFDDVFAYENGLGGGDVDVVARAAAAGWRGLYDPDVVVRHHHGRRPGPDVVTAVRAYDRGRGAFYAKCALDKRMRRTYLAGWLVLTWGRVRRRESLRPVVREFEGAIRYFRLRARSRRDVRRDPR
jgi:glycosyltransferase involved in cell wall biosynthesis